MYMATGVNGRFRAVAAQHVGPGNRTGFGGVTVLHLDQGAETAVAGKAKKKTATFPLPGLWGKDCHGHETIIDHMIVQVGKYVFLIFTYFVLQPNNSIILILFSEGRVKKNMEISILLLTPHPKVWNINKNNKPPPIRCKRNMARMAQNSLKQSSKHTTYFKSYNL